MKTNKWLINVLSWHWHSVMMINGFCYIVSYEYYFNSHIHKMGPRGPKHHSWQPVFTEKCQKAQIACVLLFCCQKAYITIFRIHKKLWILFLFSLSPQGSIIWTKITISCEFRALRVKLWFSRMKMEEYMESELSSIFGVKLFPKNIVFGCLGVSELSLQCTVSLKKSANFLRQTVRL